MPEKSPPFKVNKDQAARYRLAVKSEWRCYYCGKDMSVCASYESAFKQYPHPDMPTIDHFIAKRNGGTNSQDNLVLACLDCNMIKKAKTPEEFRYHMQYVASGISAILAGLDALARRHSEYAGVAHVIKQDVLSRMTPYVFYGEREGSDE